MYYAGFFFAGVLSGVEMPLTERMGVYGTDTDSRRSEDHAEVF